MADQLDDMIDRIRSGEINSGALNIATKQVEVITVSQIEVGGDSAANSMHAEVGRIFTEFFIQPAQEENAIERFTIRNNRLGVFSRLVQNTARYEHGRIPPGIIDADGIIHMLVVDYLRSHDGNIPEDVKDGLRTLIKDRLADTNMMNGRY